MSTLLRAIAVFGGVAIAWFVFKITIALFGEALRDTFVYELLVFLSHHWRFYLILISVLTAIGYLIGILFGKAEMFAYIGLGIGVVISIMCTPLLGDLDAYDNAKKEIAASLEKRKAAALEESEALKEDAVAEAGKEGRHY